MKHLAPFFAACAAALFATPGRAQSNGAPGEPPPCDGLAEAAGAAPPDVEPGFGFLFVTSPPVGALAPRNVEIRLGGDLSGLDVDPPTVSVEVRDLVGARVPMTRDGSVLRPTEPLPAGETFLVRIEATPAHPCPDCVGTQELAFSTTDEIDTTPPALVGPPAANVFVLPPPEEAARCGFFFGTTHQIVVDLGASAPAQTWIDVAARKEGEAPIFLVEAFNNGAPFPITANAGAQLPVALGDAFYLSFAARDLAGNVGAPKIIRVLARSFVDQTVPADALPPLWCEMPEAPSFTVPALLPTNGQVVVDFPFEEVPLALVPAGEVPGADNVIPLIPLEETALGHVYGTVSGLPNDASLDIVGLPCPHCVCDRCDDFAPVRISTSEGPDNVPPAAPIVRELLEDTSPEVSAEEACRPDRPALVVVLEPGQDDVAAPLELRYDAVIRLEGGPPRVLATAAAPLRRADGGTVLRLETRDLGRVLGAPFELTLEAVDVAGNRAAVTTFHQPDGGAGCASSGGTSWTLALLALALARRRS